jgi:hypothetical protein
MSARQTANTPASRPITTYLLRRLCMAIGSSMAISTESIESVQRDSESDPLNKRARGIPGFSQSRQYGPRNHKLGYA